jgi:hypothetical protein
MDLENARRLVGAAAANGLVYDETFPLSTPRAEFDRVFKEFDEQVARGNELRACWTLTGRYRVSSIDNEVAIPAITFAQHDLHGFVELIEQIEGAELGYELASFALQQADHESCCAWIEIAKAPRLVALATVTALRGLLAVDQGNSKSSGPVERLAQALRTKSPEQRSKLWWQIAAASHFLGPMHDRSRLAITLWERAAEEISVDDDPDLQRAFAYSEVLLPHCRHARALLACIANRLGDDGRRAVSTLVLQDFSRRLEAEKEYLPDLSQPMEREYISACGWAIAVAFGSGEAWWRAALSGRLPTLPSWRRVPGSTEKSALILIAAVHAVAILAHAGSPLANSLGDEVLTCADAWLPRWLWHHTALRSAVRQLASICTTTELMLRPEGSERLLRFVHELRDAQALADLISRIEQAKIDQTVFNAVRLVENERRTYEALLNPVDTHKEQ